jgi:cyanate permease
MRPQERLAYIVTAIMLSAITAMYWWAADPPNPWIFCITGGGALLCVGIILAKRRAGHYD